MAFENVLIIVIIIGVLLFGAKKLPELARALGRAQAEFERGKRESIREISQEASESAKQNEPTFEPKSDDSTF
jgi:Sec-independent protein secretion pathway components